MKPQSLLLICVVVMLSFHLSRGQVAISTDGSKPDNSAMLDVQSTEKGILVPRMTMLQRNMIENPATGLVIFQTDNTPGLYYNSGPPTEAAWTLIGSNSLQWFANGANLSYNDGYIGIGIANPETQLDVRSQNTGEGGTITLGNSDVSHKLVLFGGGENNPGPFIKWTQSDPLKFATDDGGWSEKMRITNDGKLGIGTQTPDNSSLVDMTSTSKGFLPPRMTQVQIAAITNPADGLIAYCTTDGKLYTYVASAGTWKEILFGSGSILPSFACGSSLTINHLTGTVAPVTKTVTYNTVGNIPGEPSKCWITSNLGADHQADFARDSTEASAGWYWQFNLKQGYMCSAGSAITPSWAILSINENSGWLLQNDPCQSELGNGWRIPTYTEWFNADAAGNWINLDAAWSSPLKLHAAGKILPEGILSNRGSIGSYWSNTQRNNYMGFDLFFIDTFCQLVNDYKTTGASIRCLREQ